MNLPSSRSGKAVAVHAVTAFAVVSAVLVSCGAPAVPCVSMAPASELVTSAAVFHVDVYSTKSRCSDPGGPGGAPVLSRSFAPGASIELDVDAGTRPVVLTAFSDAGALNAIGIACTEASFDAGRKICLDLTLTTPPDLFGADFSMPPDMTVLSCDPSNPSSCGAETCCENICHTVTADIDHCGGCRACSNTEVATRSCAAGLCNSTCGTGFANCKQPASPTADDGCETNINTLTSDCGGCGHACSTTNAKSVACNAGVCVPACNSGFISCKAPTAPAADDGCECTGSTCCPGGACQTVHSNGVGDTFNDCTAPNTYTMAQAIDARNAYPFGIGDSAPTCGNGTPVVCRAVVGACSCWGYSNGTSAPGTGHVHTDPLMCVCPTAGDPSWN